LAEAVRCASEKIADLIDDDERGFIEEGRRADFAVLDDAGMVVETWIRGEKVYEAPRRASRDATQDYELQLMLLEQQNQKRLVLAREKHDNDYSVEGTL